MASKVFISWGGDLSKQLAEAIRDWLPCVLQFVKPYFTPNDIEKGARWESDVAQELSTSDVGIICLTKDNITRPWILFEAGALSKKFEESRVCTILFNLDNAQVQQPLASLQSTIFEKKDFKKLIESINKTGGDSCLEAKVLDSVFDMWWPQLENKIKNILDGYVDNNVAPTTDVGITESKKLDEILGLVRLVSKKNLQNTSRAQESLSDLLMALERWRRYTVITKKDLYVSDDLKELIYPSIENLCMALDRPEWFGTFLMNMNDIEHSIKTK